MLPFSSTLFFFFLYEQIPEGNRNGMVVDYVRNGNGENMDQIGDMPPAFVMSQSQSTPALERFAPQER